MDNNGNENVLVHGWFLPDTVWARLIIIPVLSFHLSRKAPRFTSLIVPQHPIRSCNILPLLRRTYDEGTAQLH